MEVLEDRNWTANTNKERNQSKRKKDENNSIRKINKVKAEQRGRDKRDGKTERQYA